MESSNAIEELEPSPNFTHWICRLGYQHSTRSMNCAGHEKAVKSKSAQPKPAEKEFEDGLF